MVQTCLNSSSTMKLSSHNRRLRAGATRGFTLIEVMISMAVVAMMFVSLYAGITQGLAVIATAREDMRATQIMIEKIELLRLYSWDQMKEPGFIPAAFAERLMPSTTTNSSTTAASVEGLAMPGGVGTVFVGTIALTVPTNGLAYSNSMRLATLTVAWTNGNVRRSRSMQTYVAQLGIHDYVY
jgi:prepilin-type N-terminal cleavage/methylation domain-containing protein